MSLEQTSLCVVDEAGTVVREAKVASELAVFCGFFANLDFSVFGEWSPIVFIFSISYI